MRRINLASRVRVNEMSDYGERKVEEDRERSSKEDETFVLRWTVTERDCRSFITCHGRELILGGAKWQHMTDLS